MAENKNRHTVEFLRMLQALPLDVKIAKTQQRIREWVQYYGVDGVYVSFSGGKDSTVLLHIARKLYPNIEAVFVDTGLEDPSVKEFVKTVDNVMTIRPKRNFRDVIIRFGYPFIGKEQAQSIYYARAGQPSCLQKFDPESKHSTKYGPKFDLTKYKALLTTNFQLSHMCCYDMKKKPLKAYIRKSKKKPIIGTMAEESLLRETTWLRQGCNSFEGKKETSKPLSFWTEQDILAYIKENNLKIASAYGEIIEQNGKLKCTLCNRTGCIFCGFGAHMENGDNEILRFIYLKKYHPKLYDYCMRGGEFNDKGIWQPNKDGLGMAYVIDELNKLYSKTLKDGTVKKFIIY